MSNHKTIGKKQKWFFEREYLVFYFDFCFDISFEKCGYFDNRPRINLNFIFFRLQLIFPFRNKWTDECVPPKYGIAIHNNTFWIYKGGEGNHNGGNKWWTWNLPFITMHWVRTSILLKDATWAHSTPKNPEHFYEDVWKNKQMCFHYDYTDSYDGEIIPTKVYVETMEWRPKWLKWTSKFAKIRKTIDIDFSKQVGSRKGSWKGGVLGCSYELLPHESPKACIQRMERLRKFN